MVNHMLQFAANLSMLYPELDFLDRFNAAADDGFQAVEYLFPYDFKAQDIAHRLQSLGLVQVLFNAPPGDWAVGERGLACLPDREDEFRQSIDRALEYATALQCPRIHVMAGLQPQGQSRAELMALYTRRMAWAAERASHVGVDVLMEPINIRDIPGFFLNRQDEAHAVVAAVGAGNLKVQMDLYHCQIVEGDVATKIRHYLPTGNVGHIQIAGVPARNEPDLGELNYTYLFQVLEELGYAGWIGCEYRPLKGAVANGTSSGLQWFKSLL
jgi:hydroxypyruvate isomerase